MRKWKNYEVILTNVVEDKDSPYIKIEQVVRKVKLKYNPNYGDNRMCKCGHPYHRHFDSYEDMAPIGCKYCRCGEFVEAVD